MFGFTSCLPFICCSCSYDATTSFSWFLHCCRSCSRNSACLLVFLVSSFACCSCLASVWSCVWRGSCFCQRSIQWCFYENISLFFKSFPPSGHHLERSAVSHAATASYTAPGSPSSLRPCCAWGFSTFAAQQRVSPSLSRCSEGPPATGKAHISITALPNNQNVSGRPVNMLLPRFKMYVAQLSLAEKLEAVMVSALIRLLIFFIPSI